MTPHFQTWYRQSSESALSQTKSLVDVFYSYYTTYTAEREPVNLAIWVCRIADAPDDCTNSGDQWVDRAESAVMPAVWIRSRRTDSRHCPPSSAGRPPPCFRSPSGRAGDSSRRSHTARCTSRESRRQIIKEYFFVRFTLQCRDLLRWCYSKWGVSWNYNTTRIFVIREKRTFFLTNLSQYICGKVGLASTKRSHCARRLSSFGWSAIHMPSNSSCREISFSRLKITSGTYSIIHTE